MTVLDVYQSRQTSVEDGIKLYGKQGASWASKAAMVDDMAQESFRHLQEYQNRILEGQREFSILFNEENQRLGRLIQIRDECRAQEDKCRRTKEYLEWMLLS